MQRRSGVVVGVVIVVALLALLAVLRRCGDRTSTPSPPAHTVDHRAAGSTLLGASRPDPRTLPRAAISGTITDDAKAPIARAQVCAAATGDALPSAITRALTCAITDEQGRYRIGDLIAADYLVHASARPFRPAAYFPTPGASNHEFSLAAGETRTGVDLQLKRGGAELGGVVFDVSGGPVAHAEVRDATNGSAHASAAVETDEQGRFSLWVARGNATIDVIADGYAPARQRSRSPGQIEVFLTPESSLAGVVVDATTEQPVPGAIVAVEVGRHETAPDVRDITDAQGRFRLEHLTPGRYTVAARVEHGYGRSPGSLLVGLGQHVDGATIKLFPAQRVAGRVVIASSRKDCADANVALRGGPRVVAVDLRAQPDGGYIADGIIPGTYTVSVRCAGYVVRDSYPPIVVEDRDVTGLAWEVDEGARIRGKVVTRSGVALDGVSLRAQSIQTHKPTTWSFARSKADGSFELTGLRAGTHRITLTTDRGAVPSEGFEVTVEPAATLAHDFVLDDPGELIGSVVDEDAVPVADVNIMLTGPDRRYRDATSDAAGAFTVDALAPGDYRITAYRDMERAVGDKAPTSVTIRAGKTATVKLTLAAQRGTIRGTVIDAASQPVPDAFVSWALETERHVESAVASTRAEWRSDARPVLTASDGSFQLTRLAEGRYTLRAYRKGGGEAIAEHVAIGATAKLQIKPTGSIAGTARRAGGAPVRGLDLRLEDHTSGLERSESFYMTGGRFSVTDLPAGRFDLTAHADGGQATVTVELGEGEARTGVDLELAQLVTVTGRIVEHGTRKPVPAFHVAATPLREGQTDNTLFIEDHGRNISDEAGRFLLPDVPAGPVALQAIPRDLESRDSGRVYVRRTITGPGPVDVGDLVAVRSRYKPGEPVGALGIQLKALPPNALPEQRELMISAIDPAGPAARSGLQVGDVITTCDEIDVSGPATSNWWTLIMAPPGTKLTLGTRRGVTATIVLAAPPARPDIARPAR
jgi:Carboxypeptidase regulatory-like domain/PDZ domain